MKIVMVLLSLALLSSCSVSNKNSENKSEKALTLVKKVCSGDKELSWKERASLAAQANFLDGRWERLADATYIQAGSEQLAEDIKNGNFRDFPEPTLEKLYEAKFQYSKVLAECAIIELLDERNN